MSCKESLNSIKLVSLGTAVRSKEKTFEPKEEETIDEDDGRNGYWEE